MTKNEFLQSLELRLEDFPTEEIKKYVEYYGEMIDDRIEEGMTEEKAVADVGSVEDAVEQILSQMPLARLVKEKIKSGNKLKGWQLALIIAGSPLWLAFAIAAFAIFISVYAVLWSLIVTVWSVEVALGASALGLTFGSAILFTFSGAGAGLLAIGIGLVCGGLGIFAFIGCVKATKGMAILSKKIVIFIKSWFIKKEAAK